MLLYFLAAVLFGLRAFGVGGPRVHLGWLGAMVFTLAVVLPPLFAQT